MSQDKTSLTKKQNKTAGGIFKFLAQYLTSTRVQSIRLAIAGPWGVGKSHVMKELIGILKAETPKVEVHQEDNLDYQEPAKIKEHLLQVINTQEDDGSGLDVRHVDNVPMYLCSVNIDRLFKILVASGTVEDEQGARNLFSSAYGQVFYISPVESREAVETFWPVERGFEQDDRAEGPNWLGDELLYEYLCHTIEPLRTLKDLCVSFFAFSRSHAEGGINEMKKHADLSDTSYLRQGQAAFALLLHMRQVMLDVYNEWVQHWEYLDPLFEALQGIADVVSDMPPRRRLPEELDAKLGDIADGLDSYLFPVTADALRGDRQFIKFWKGYSDAIAMAWNELWPSEEIYSVRPLLSEHYFAFIKGTLRQ